MPAIGDIYAEDQQNILYAGATKAGIDFKIWLKSKRTGVTTLVLDPQSLFGQEALTVSATLGPTDAVYAFVRQKIAPQVNDNFLYEVNTKTLSKKLLARSSQLGINQVLLGPINYDLTSDSLIFNASFTERLPNGTVRTDFQRVRLTPMHGPSRRLSIVHD